MSKVASKLIMPKHVWDKKGPAKEKKELEKVPTPTGFRMVLFRIQRNNFGCTVVLSSGQRKNTGVTCVLLRV